MTEALSSRYVAAVRTRDRAALAALLTPDVDFRGLTPGRDWSAGSAEEVVGILLDHWFEETDVIEEAAVEDGAPVADTERMAYRFRLHNDAGPQVVEQQAYYRTDGDRLSYLRVVCSGFRPAQD